MNQNLIIGILAVLVILGGGYFLLNANKAAPGTDTTTTPAPTDNSTPAPSPTPGASATAPRVVTNSGVSPSNSTAVVTGTVTPNGAQTSYWYEYGESTTLGGKTSSQAVGSGWSAIPSPGYITGLRANTPYYFRLSAQNAYGTVNGATYSFSTNSNPPPEGSAPTVKTLSASAITRTSATLQGDVTPNKAGTQYWFEYGKNGTLGGTTALTSVGDGSAKVSASAAIANLEPATTYYYRVNAQNQFGTINGAILTFKTSGPPVSVAPAVMTQAASPVATTTATLRGTVNPNGAQTTYWFEYSTDSLLGSVLLNTTQQRSAGAGTHTSSVEANVSSLSGDTNYFYRLVARNSAGTVRGDDMTFTTK
ncbi:MAG: hypothetical protein NUV88_03590 [Candidatus Kaiserbacteria bacterium]|nr:hypothetical protein [Candidatus Kaiserbacteria bacterium]